MTDKKGENEKNKIIGFMVINLPKKEEGDIRIIKGIRTDCYTDKEQVVEIRYKIYADKNGEYILKLLNGPTGYESFYIKDNLEKHITKRAGWQACMGTKPVGLYAGWDKLFIPYVELKKIYDHALELGIMNKVSTNE